MRFSCYFLLVVPFLHASWDDVTRLAANDKVEIVRSDKTRQSARFVRADAEAIVVTSKSGEQAIDKAQVREVRVADPSRRVRSGLITTIIGGGAGLAIGWVICAHCVTEGKPLRFIGPLAGIGAALGALGFIGTPYRRVYRQ